MSLISHLIDELKRHAQAYETGDQEGAVTAISTAKVLREAAWTIEEQAEKIQANNLNGGWMPVKKGLPEKDGDYLVTKQTLDGLYTFVDIYSYIPSNADHYKDVWQPKKTVYGDYPHKVIAWWQGLKPYAE